MTNVAVGILIRKGQVLLCQRKRWARYGLKWEFPGGKVEHGEKLEDCLRRELAEELNIDAVALPLYHRQSYEYADSGRFDVHYHLVPSFVGEPKNCVFETISWVNIARLGEYDILEGNRDVVQKLIDEYGAARTETR